MGGRLGKILNSIVDEYNTSQNQYVIKAYYKGNYTESLNAAVAAYRAKRHPNLIQVFEVGTQSMMQSNAIIPVEEILSQE